MTYKLIDVLIETLWNVKNPRLIAFSLAIFRINRNIVECKDDMWRRTAGSTVVLIETLWNVKGILPSL